MDYKTEIINIAPDSNLTIWSAHALLGTKLEPSENVYLKIVKGRIKGIEKNCPAPETSGKRIGQPVYLFGRSHTLIPSLIDAHVHLTLNGVNFRKSERIIDRQGSLAPRVKADLLSILNCGIGIVRDGGDYRAFNLEIRDQVERGRTAGPRVIATGEALRRQNGYGFFLGRGYNKVEEIELIIDDLCRRKIDQLKVILSGVVDFDAYGLVEGEQLPRSDLDMIIGAARERGLKVMAHASSASAVELAVCCGVDSIEHGYYVTDNLLESMARKNIAWIPTVIPVAAQVTGPQFGKVKNSRAVTIRKIYREQVEKIGKAYSLGVKLGMGTDSGAPAVRHGLSLLQEAALYRESGLPLKSILQALTVNNASILGLELETGSITQGSVPYLAAVRGNPLVELNALSQVAAHFVPSPAFPAASGI